MGQGIFTGQVVQLGTKGKIFCCYFFEREIQKKKKMWWEERKNQEASNRSGRKETAGKNGNLSGKAELGAAGEGQSATGSYWEPAASLTCDFLSQIEPNL